MHTTSNPCSHSSLVKKNVAIFIALLLLCLTFVHSSNAQTAYKIGGKQALMTLNGTSTLHDWTMTAHSFSGKAQFDVSNDNKLNGLESLTLTLLVANLKGESGGLNDNAYKALKADHWKNITFLLTSAQLTSTGVQKYKIVAVGNLTIAGVTKPITLIVMAQVDADGTIACSGTVPLKMSDFGVERPSFMLGAMKASDALTLEFALTFIQ